MVTIVQAGPIEQSVRVARQLAVVAVRTLDRALLSGFAKLYVWQERARQRHQLAEMSEQRDSMAAHWEREKSSLNAVSQLQEEKNLKEEEAARLERDADLAGAAAIRYGELPELERRIAEANEDLAKLTRAMRRGDGEG